jgi:3-methyladenine DNA glycosylase AlkD
MVIKALSWALRELSKRDPSSVKNFLLEQREAVAPRVVREVNNKLKTGLKNPR